MAIFNPIARWFRPRLLAAMALACAASTGCTAMTNPVADGIPVRLLPPELLGPSKAHYQTIPLSVLRQPQPDAHRLDAGDVIGVAMLDFVQAPPPPVGAASALRGGVGHPVTVLHDGNIVLPGIPKLNVKGLTIDETRLAIQKHYTDLKLEPGPIAKLTVTLIHARQTQVLVFRQEAPSFQAGQEGTIPMSKRNTGWVIDLPAYQNDVLHALAKSGGLPDFDAYNEIIIHRDSMRNKLANQPPDKNKRVGETIRIPLRQPFGTPMPFGGDDVVLRTGDVVFLEARDEQVFYTGGLLPPGKHIIPRDHDLDVLEAIAQVRGPLYNGAFGGSNLSGTLVAPGLGNPSPSLLVVVRRIPNRGQVHIAVDLARPCVTRRSAS